MAKEKLFQVGVKALIENKEGRFLLFRADTTYEHVGNVKQYWDLAGGRIKEGQTVDTALRREIEEETGIKEIESFEFFTAVVSNHEIPIAEGRKTGLILMIYRVKIAEKAEIILSPEHDLFEWADKKTAAKRLADKYPPEFTKNSFRRLK
jgi:8-oxo-dGTP diphosphatase